MISYIASDLYGQVIYRDIAGRKNATGQLVQGPGS